MILYKMPRYAIFSKVLEGSSKFLDKSGQQNTSHVPIHIPIKMEQNLLETKWSTEQSDIIKYPDGKSFTERKINQTKVQWSIQFRSLQVSSKSGKQAERNSYFCLVSIPFN